MDENSSVDNKTGLFLVFSLDEQLYGAPVANIREIIPMLEITPVPKSPPFIKGVINLRGVIVPIIDIRRKLKSKDKKPDSRTCIVVTDAVERDYGFMADCVTDCLEIREITSTEISKAKYAPDKKFIRGIGQHSGHIVIILALDRILSSTEQKALKIT